MDASQKKQWTLARLRDFHAVLRGSRLVGRFAGLDGQHLEALKTRFGNHLKSRGSSILRGLGASAGRLIGLIHNAVGYLEGINRAYQVGRGAS